MLAAGPNQNSGRCGERCRATARPSARVPTDGCASMTTIAARPPPRDRGDVPGEAKNAFHVQGAAGKLRELDAGKEAAEHVPLTEIGVGNANEKEEKGGAVKKTVHWHPKDEVESFQGRTSLPRDFGQDTTPRIILHSVPMSAH